MAAWTTFQTVPVLAFDALWKDTARVNLGPLGARRQRRDIGLSSPAALLFLSPAAFYVFFGFEIFNVRFIVRAVFLLFFVHI